MKLPWWSGARLYPFLASIAVLHGVAAAGFFGLDLWSGPALAWGTLIKLAFLSTAAGYATACVIRGQSAAWRLMAAGFIAYAVAQGILVVYNLILGIPLPFPSWADLFFISGSFALLIGLWTFLIELGRSGVPLELRRRLPVDSAWIFGAGALGIWAVMHSVFAVEVDPREAWLSLVYPLADLLLLMPALLLFQATRPMRGGQVRRVWSTLLLGTVLFLLGDLLFTILTGSVDPWLAWAVDISYIVGYALCAKACAMQFDMMR